VFDQLNLVVEDVDAVIAFYRKLGLKIEDDGREWPPGSGARHIELEFPNGNRIEFDSASMAKVWRGDSKPGVVIGFSVESRDAVDTLYANLVNSGHKTVKSPHDAFWGARYAIVKDPAGNDVGLMSPIDQSKRSKQPDP
jgi:uncharacterized glyoxalase superfamily protein PhnB